MVGLSEMRGSTQTVVVLALLVAAGCDQVFELQRDPPLQFANYDRCGPFLYDEPLRYATILNPNPGGTDPQGNPIAPKAWSWDDARTSCQLRGMDLAVFNNDHELGMANEAPAWPFWIGQQMDGGTTVTVDGCPSFDAQVAARYVAADVTACGVVAGPLQIAAASCDGKLPAGMEPSVVLSAMCETPRPDSVTCLGADPQRTKYIMSDSAMTYDKARAFCSAKSAHLLVVETEAEWRYVSTMTKASWEKPFWLGSQLQGTEWKTVTGCYGTYSWTGNDPGTPASGSCVAGKVRSVIDPEPGLSGTVLDGVAATTCDDQNFALCEDD